MKKKLIAGLVIIMTLSCTLCSLGVLALETFNPGTFVKEETLTNEVLQEEELMNVVDEESVSMDLSKYKQTDYSAFSVMEGSYELYFEDLTSVFEYLVAHDEDRTENSISIITDIIFDKDYTLPNLKNPIEFTAQVSRMVDMNGYNLFDSYGEKVDLSNIKNIMLVDNTDVGLVSESETETQIPEETTETFSVNRVGVYRYKDMNGKVLSEQSVGSIEELTPPNIPTVQGLDCLGWGEPEEVEEGIFDIVPMYYKLGTDYEVVH